MDTHAAQAPLAAVTPLGAAGACLTALLSGHGEDGTANCAEFCPT
jgi:hypothetical protein